MQPLESVGAALAVPGSAFTSSGFRAWMASLEFPEQCPKEWRIDLCSGEMLVDMSPERVRTHVMLKGELYRALSTLTQVNNEGQIFCDGVTYSHDASGLVAQPDALYFRHESFRAGLVEGGEETDHPLGFQGTVDWVLEVVSPSSQQKDRKKLFEAYAVAGVSEYWIADATGEKVVLEIYKLSADGYELVPRADGWQRSDVFKKSVRLEAGTSEIGLPDYRLRLRLA